MQMSSNLSSQKNRIHPHKFTLWVAIGSIIMMFAGLTSAYIVKRSQGNWLPFGLPQVFWYSTVVIILSSLTMQIAFKQFKAREIQRYKTFTAITVFLGLLFAALQVAGFAQLKDKGIQLLGTGSNSSASFLFVITALHILHMLGGIVALVIVFFRAFGRRIKQYNSTPLEIVSIYWHFVDVLWIYLFVFLLWAGS
jgi:cytochrome c oxidase subunit III